MTFADFSGRSVYHCHILDHEDAGMRATIQVAC
ncbi:MAG: multicopper oxidase domain-containing protein [Streptosporangiales bacterium]|nr:multicopper oxidase domain-containing protein [Streptosporangiales bacterium]